ncbi:MAG: T9SS type A sorting domain-containing protein [Flavobacteriales bacterium]
MYQRLTTIALLCCGLSVAGYGQSSVLSGGADASGSGGSVSYSVGQVGYVNSGSGTTVAAGVQQPFEISDISGIAGGRPSINAQVYPNPTVGSVVLRSENTTAPIYYMLYNINGKLVANGNVSGQKNTIDLSQLTPATYMLELEQENTYGTFKIIKNQ